MMFSFAKSKFASVAWLECILPRRARRIANRTALFGIAVSLLISSPRLFAAMLGLRLLLLMLDAYGRSATTDPRGDAGADNLAGRMNWHAAMIWRAASTYRATPRSFADLAAGFARPAVGHAILTRLGISQRQYQEALAAPSNPADIPSDPKLILAPLMAKNQQIASGDFLGLLFVNHTPTRGLFLASGLTEEDLTGAASWVERSLDARDLQERWWSRARLSAIPGIGKKWAYGRTFLLNQFGRELASGTHGQSGREDELHLLETALLKQSGANTLLIGDPGAGKKTILAGLAGRIRQGIASPLLEDKRVMMLDGVAVTGSAKTKGDTEALLIAILNEATAAGNIILAIAAFPEFVASLASLGVNAGQILVPYLADPALHIVALADTAPFRRTIASDAGLLSHFETIYLDDIDRARLIEILENHAPALEGAYRGRILITYSALRAAADAALNHLTEGALPGRAIGLMEEAAAAAGGAAKRNIVTPEYVMRIVSQKTHLPMGAITGDERLALQNLEPTLHARVVGQDTAIAAIADAIRRARTGVRNPRRPIGSFLFLGPTGVGKTESAKALAAVYFGNEERMIRFDMSEYQTEEDVGKLLGSAGRNDPGMLAAAVRQSPYAVLLLDEFEKSRLEIRNIFLQILDEGFFTNALGERVILRDMIIIATSNAGALLIQNMVRQGKNPAAEKDTIIDAIEREAHLAPELLNRFDSLVIFSPLDATALHAVAGLMLAKLAVRLKEQNYILDITPELITATATGGFDPQFGARPMQRWIQDHIEKAVTDGILSGTIAPGAAFAVNPVDFTIA